MGEIVLISICTGVVAVILGYLFYLLVKYVGIPVNNAVESFVGEFLPPPIVKAKKPELIECPHCCEIINHGSKICIHCGAKLWR